MTSSTSSSAAVARAVALAFPIAWLILLLVLPYETNQPIYVLRGSKEPLQKAWPTVKHYE